MAKSFLWIFPDIIVLKFNTFYAIFILIPIVALTKIWVENIWYLRNDKEIWKLEKVQPLVQLLK